MGEGTGDGRGSGGEGKGDGIGSGGDGSGSGGEGSGDGSGSVGDGAIEGRGGTSDIEADDALTLRADVAPPSVSHATRLARITIRDTPSGNLVSLTKQQRRLRGHYWFTNDWRSLDLSTKAGQLRPRYPRDIDALVDRPPARAAT